MFQALRQLWRLLTADQRRQLVRLQALVVLMAFAELVGVASIVPFMTVVGDTQQLYGDGVLGRLFVASGFEDPAHFLVLLGLGVLVAMTVATVISIVTIWRLSMYAQSIGAALADRLYAHYLHQPWLYHTQHNSSELTSRIVHEVGRLTSSIIVPALNINARAGVALVLVFAVLLYNPAVALVGVAFFGLAYLMLYRFVRRRLSANSQTIGRAQATRLRMMSEALGGVKDTLLLGCQSYFIERFCAASREFAASQSSNQVISLVPRYAMELVAFGAIILLMIYLLAVHQGQLGNVLPVLSVYALAGFKLLPAFQQIYHGVSEIRGNLSALERLQADLAASASSADVRTTHTPGVPSRQNTLGARRNREPGAQVGRLAGVAASDVPTIAPTFPAFQPPRRSIQLDRVTFAYPGKREPVLRDLSLEIPVNAVIGLVGSSGAGKSTLVDLLLGLIQPQTGRLLLDGRPLLADHLRDWQERLGYVPQSIFLADASLRDNIAFGLPSDMIDDAKVERAARLAHLGPLLDSLPEGLNTVVGERGVQLSGGQRQRVGIARALYHDAETLILDEATSALDGLTERAIMEAIHDFAGNKTIVIVAHRLKTVRACDRIYLLEAGRVIDSGRFDELETRCALFRRMVASA